MKRNNTNLIGRTFVVVSQTEFRLILEEDFMGERGGAVVVVDSKSIPDAHHGTLKIVESR